MHARENTAPYDWQKESDFMPHEQKSQFFPDTKKDYGLLFISMTIGSLIG
jgi:hypothetical protein